MENPVSFQLSQLLESLLLGLSLALLFDLLHLPRRLLQRLRQRNSKNKTNQRRHKNRHSIWTHLTDLLYLLILLPTLLLFALYVGNGRLRVFMLIFAVTGAALYATAKHLLTTAVRPRIFCSGRCPHRP